MPFITADPPVVIDVQTAGITTHVGMWSAATSGAFRRDNRLTSSEVFAAQCQLKVAVS